jgi:hypothetical protein
MTMQYDDLTRETPASMSDADLLFEVRDNVETAIEVDPDPWYDDARHELLSAARMMIAELDRRGYPDTIAVEDLRRAIDAELGGSIGHA